MNITIIQQIFSFILFFLMGFVIGLYFYRHFINMPKKNIYEVNNHYANVCVNNPNRTKPDFCSSPNCDCVNQVCHDFPNECDSDTRIFACK